MGEKEIISEKELKAINNLTRKDYKADELYTFRLVCCDNQVDRDYEKFSDEALYEMARMYVGTTIIKDHEPRSDNQTARIYRCLVEDCGNGLKRLIAYAYVPIIDSTKDFIEEVKSGMKKEVSVGCAVRKRICSVCGKNQSSCNHIPGREYEGKRCIKTLSGISDVYEVSFVAVPAQKNAGVIKSFDVKKCLSLTDESKSDQAVKQEVEKELLELEITEFEKEFCK